MDARSPSVFLRSSYSAAISSSFYLAGNHEVFISFRGYDVRRGFLEHLFRALKFKQINAFIDDDLDRGKNIFSCLFQVIEKSDLSIVIFSQNYPKSEWCMEELRKIHDSMMDRKQRVIPVFYEVDPSHVQNQQGNYAIEKQKWRDALKEIGNLSGFDSKNYSNDAELIDDIVDNVCMILLEICPSISHNEGLFGIDSSIKDVEKLLHLDSRNDVRMVGIWGMGGIGKTTIASKVFDRNKNKFSGSCFVSNVRETLSTRDGLISLRDKIIRELLGDKDIKIDSSPLVDYSIRKRIKRTEMLLVLDDVLTCTQLRSLMETSGFYYPDSLCPGSRIVVTSRDAQVLRDVIFKSGIYEAKELKDAEALHLLSWHAFGQKNPPQGYEKLAEEVVQYAHGVPLALIVVGSEIKHKSTSQWRDALRKINSISPFEINKILRISFDELDRDEKHIFLDIACFLKGYERDYVVNVLDNLGFHARIGIDRLIDKSLLKEENKEGTIIITMHDLLEQMGQEILIEEKESKRHQSRLLTFNEIKDAFANDKRTENVEVISIKHWNGGKIDINPQAFVHMCKLTFLNFNFNFYPPNVNCPMGLEFLPSSIKYLKWDFFPLNYMPSNFYPEKLVELHLKGSELKEIIFSQPLVSLKLICLLGSENLMRVSDLAMAPNLEVLELSYCVSLVEVGSSLVKLNKLKTLGAIECKSLSRLPELPYSIENLGLSGSGLRRLPSTVGRLITKLKVLSLSYCQELEFLPTTISSLLSLEVMDLRSCSRLVEIGWSLENLGNLIRFDVRGCLNLLSLPELPSSIVELNLSNSGLKKMPLTIGHLTRLKELSLLLCQNLESLPSSFCNLTSLETLDLSYCGNIQELPEDFGNLKSLEELHAYYSGLTELPRSIENLKKLKKLDLRGCKKLKSLPALPSSLEEFYATHFISLVNKETSSIVESYLRNVPDQPTKIHKLCIDGSQLPKWMMIRNECGTSIFLEVETIGHFGNLVLCVVVLSNCTSHVFPYSKPLAIVTNESSETNQSFAYYDDRTRISFDREEPSYYFIWNCNIDCKVVKEVSVKLVARLEEGDTVKCAVHPIFHSKNYSSITDL